jgi:hypothetical protein
MSRPSLVCVMTTIQPPTDCARRLDDTLKTVGARAVVVGDKKGPARFELPCADFYSLADQQRLPYRLAALLPTGHYVRKNLGYLAGRGGGACRDRRRQSAHRRLAAARVVTQAQPVTARPWMNVYRVFADANIWPRLPARPSQRLANVVPRFARPGAVYAPIQQDWRTGPDVVRCGDWCSIASSIPPRPSLWLPPGTWCPFNSQTTWWWPEAYPLLYLPSHCSFRMTDIWRVSSRAASGDGTRAGVPRGEQFSSATSTICCATSATVPGYLHNGEIVRTLDRTPLRRGRRPR